MVAAPPLQPQPSIGRVNPDGTPTQAQIDYERQFAAWVQTYTSSLVTGIPFPSSTTLGGVLSATAPTHQFQRGIDTAGNPLFAQPAAGDVSGLGPFATATTIAAGDVSGLGSLATLSSIDLASQATGNLAVSRLNSGIDADNTRFWRGDGTWATVTASPGGTSGQIQFNSAGSFAGFTVGGDGTLDPVTGSLVVTKTNGVSFSASATTDATNASNIASGTLGAARLPAFGSGDVSFASGGGAGTIANDAVTYAKMQNISATSRFLGRKTAAAGDPEELTASDAKTILAIAAGDVSGLATVATTGSASDLGSGTLPAARLPNPSSSTLGGVQSKAAVSHQFLTSISTSGVPASAQPAAADLSDGTTGSGAVVLANGANITSPSITNPSLSGVSITSGAISGVSFGDLNTIITGLGFLGSTSGKLIVKAAAVAGTSTLTLPGGTTDFSATGGTSQVVKQTSAGGAFTVAQLASSDISGLAASATTDATNASNISSGTLAVARGGVDQTAWATYSPIVTNQDGVTNVATSSSGAYKVRGKSVECEGKVVFNATGGSWAQFQLPFTSLRDASFACVNRNTGVITCRADAGNAFAYIQAAGLGFPGSSGHTIQFSGTFEVA